MERSAGRWSATAIAFVLAAQIATLWAVPFVPSQDGPVHQEIAAQLAALRATPSGPVGEYFRLNPRPEPNWLVYPLLEALARSFGWQAAHKIVLTAYLIALPFALAYALAASGRGATFLAAFALPLGANYLVHMGFLNFALSLPLGLLSLGYGLRLGERESLARRSVLAALLLVTAVAHLVSVCVAMVVLGCAGAWRHGAAAAGRPNARLAAALRGLGPVVAASVPALLLTASFLTGGSHHAVSWEAPLDLVRRLLLLHVLVSYDRAELVPAVACAALLGGCAIRRLASWRTRTPQARGDDMLAGVVVLLVLYFVLPASLSGGGYLNPRLSLWVALAFILWLGSEPWPGADRRSVAVGAAALGLVFVLLHFVSYHRLSPFVEEYVSVGDALPAGATVLPLSFVDQEWQLRDRSLSAYKVRPFEHALGYVAARRGVIDLTEYQADQGYFPIVYRDEVNPYRRLVPEEGLVEDRLASIDWRRYEQAGGRVDYVLLWGRAAASSWPGEELFLLRLDADFERVFTSAPRGLAELYRRRRAR